MGNGGHYGIGYETLGWSLGDQGDSNIRYSKGFLGLGHSEDILELDIPGRFWGWVFQRDYGWIL